MQTIRLRTYVYDIYKRTIYQMKNPGIFAQDTGV